MHLKELFAAIFLLCIGMYTSAAAQSGTSITNSNPSAPAALVTPTPENFVPATPAAKFNIFIGKIRKQTKTLISVEKRVGKEVDLIFFSRTEPQKELFRMNIGQASGSEITKWWNYGIQNEADYNGDGVPDYTWYGGDDDSQEWYLLLSSNHGYQKVNLVKTLQAAWTARYHNRAPDFGELDPMRKIKGNDLILNLWPKSLLRTPSGLTLLIDVHCDGLNMKTDKPIDYTLHFQIAQADFKYE